MDLKNKEKKSSSQSKKKQFLLQLISSLRPQIMILHFFQASFNRH